MTVLHKCDRCGDVVPMEKNEEVWVPRFEVQGGKVTDNIGDATYPVMNRGATVALPIVKDTVDLCQWCRDDLHTFFQNKAVAPRHP